jgi:hypothetical protein
VSVQFFKVPELFGVGVGADVDRVGRPVVVKVGAMN